MLTVHALILAHGLVLLLPWIVCRFLFVGPIAPHRSLDQAKVMLWVNLLAAWPATIALVAAGARWLDSAHGLLLAVLIPLLWRATASAALRVRRSLPAVTSLFPLAAPALLVWWLATDLAARLEGAERSGWESLLLLIAAALTGALGAHLLGWATGRALIAMTWMYLRARFPARLARADGWQVRRLTPAQGRAVLLFGRSTAGALALLGGAPPRFRVTLTADERWSPAPAERFVGRLAEYRGRGPISSVVIGAPGPDLRSATARLDDATVAHVEELNLGGDDFFHFLSELRPV